MSAVCPVHGQPWKMVPAGVSSKTGKPYNAFYVCPVQGCARILPRPTVRDWHIEFITLQKGLVGAKPPGFCRWIIGLLGALPGDTLDDLYPGTGAMGRAWDEFRAHPTPRVSDQCDLLAPQQGDR